MAVGLRVVMIGGSLGLVIVTGAVVGAMSITTGDRAVDDTKKTGQDGLSAAFASGKKDVEAVSQQLLGKMVDEVSAEFKDYMRLPATMTSAAIQFLSLQHPDVLTEAGWIADILQPYLRSIVLSSYMRGLISTTAIVLPMAPSKMAVGDLTGGGTVGVFANPGNPGAHPWALPDGTYFMAVEARVPGPNGTDRLGSNDSYAWSGDMDMNGRMARRPEYRDACGMFTGVENPDEWRAEHTNGLMPDCPYDSNAAIPEMKYMAARMLGSGMAPVKDGNGSPLPEQPPLEPSDIPRWTGILTVSWRLTLYNYGAFSHPAWVPMSPGTPEGWPVGRPQSYRGGYVMIAMEVRGMSLIMKKVVRGVGYTGMRLYGVERHPWTGRVSSIVGASEGRDNEMYILKPEEIASDGLTWQRRALPADQSNNPVIAHHARTIIRDTSEAPNITQANAMSQGNPCGGSGESGGVSGTFTFSAAAQELVYWQDREKRGRERGEFEESFNGGWEPFPTNQQVCMLEAINKEVAFWEKQTGDVEYWTRVRTVGDSFGFFWHLAMMVPRDVMMEQIDAARISVQGNITEEYKKTEDMKEKNFYIMIVIVLSIVLVLMVLSVVAANGVAGPLSDLEVEMCEVATMQLDHIDTDKATSCLREVGSMQQSFHQMTKNLREYRQYMPKSLLIADDEEEEEEEVIAQSSKRPSTNVSAAKSGESTAQKSTVQQRRKSMESNAMTQMKAHVDAKFAQGLKAKKVSFATVNAVAWHKGTHSMSDHSVVHLHTAMLEGLIEIGDKCKGIPDSFSGDRVMWSFNAVRVVGTHRMSSVTTVSNAQKFTMSMPSNLFRKWKRKDGESGVDSSCMSSVDESTKSPVNKPGWFHAATSPTGAGGVGKLHVTGACAGGAAKVGNMGCQGVKKFTFLTPYLTLAFALERLASAAGGSCAVEKSFFEDVKGSFYSMMLDQVLFPKRSPVPFLVIDVCEPKKASEDEWMYQLEEGEKDDPYKVWNTFVQAVITAPASAADSVPRDDARAPGTKARFAQAAQDGVFHPRELLYH